MPEKPRVGRGPLIVGGSLVAVLLGAIAVFSASSSAGSTTAADYRTAAVSRGPVAQLLTLNGTAQLTEQVTAAFPASGVVTAVTVKVGDHVSAGQTLATIDPTGLRANLLAARASLAQDQASLISDQTAPAPAASGGSVASTGSSSSAAAAGSGTARTSASSSRTAPSAGGASSSGPSRTGGTPSASGAQGGSGTAKLSTAAVQGALGAAQLALRAEEQTCAPVTGTPVTAGGSHVTASRGISAGLGGTTFAPVLARKATVPTPTASPGSDPTTAVPGPSPSVTATSTPTPTTGGVAPSGEPTGTPTGTPTPTASPTTPPPVTGGTIPTAEELRACAAAMDSVSRAQKAAGAALSSLATQVVRELKVIMQAAATNVASSGSAGRTTGSGATSGSAALSTARPSGSPATPSAGSSGTNGSGSAGAGTASATRVAADEVAILQDQAAVTQAEADLAGATLKAPIAGTVGQVGLTVGQPAAASQGIVIVGPGAATVTVDIPLADMGLVHAGLSAAVTPAGDVTPVPGTLQSVNLLPASTQSTTPSYPATVLVPNPTRSMSSGSIVTVAITVGQAPDAVRVPVSAVAGLRAGTGDVEVLSGGDARAQAVTVGVVGDGYAQILTGLAAGDRVVLADAAAALPSNQTAGLRGLGGGFGGGVGGRFGGATTGTGAGRAGG
ncbi:hypothetical protein N865_01650 [Intrasporangium oryzae NRRL B-24470]|uniref:Multidrug resistance protein MdtA-like barrel-sandwich hybrid domain-containing protein n=1 Tax=Intrasporangium oryzae NRRL B-24470 TaxID=1386089 RepID=W9GAK5_9MICO|nr:HlyD family efflux transporter periplasmic adaptor subunit [Intrasporangium oryzae]EWT03216.1 hypothetical protein N865_01650 [Intrasporangium oryzae NRRL B-24470]